MAREIIPNTTSDNRVQASTPREFGDVEEFTKEDDALLESLLERKRRGDIKHVKREIKEEDGLVDLTLPVHVK